LFKNEHAVQARAQWQVRGGRAELGRRAKNIGFSQASVKLRTARRRELMFQNAHRAQARAQFCRPKMMLMTSKVSKMSTAL
jgi:hypothetical protein